MTNLQRAELFLNAAEMEARLAHDPDAGAIESVLGQVRSIEARRGLVAKRLTATDPGTVAGPKALDPVHCDPAPAPRLAKTSVLHACPQDRFLS